MRLFGEAARTGLLLTGIFLAMTLVLVPGSQAQNQYGPKLLIEEEVSCGYYHNGTTKTAPSRAGEFYISIPNNDDVLQYIKITLNSGYDTYTNIENSTGAFHDVVASYPNEFDWEYLYVNTSTSQGASETGDTSYTITDQLPTINISMAYKNTKGGKELFDVRNIASPYNDVYLNFTLTNPSSTAINGGTAYIYFERDVNGVNDIEVVSVEDYNNAGTASTIDTETDGQDDAVSWTGVQIAGSSHANLTIHLNITRGYQIESGDDYINLDEGTKGPTADTGGNYTYTGTGALFTKVSVSDKFARGPVRQGVDLSYNSNIWWVRGFFRNRGDAAGAGEFNLTYNVSMWRIYEVSATTGLPNTKLQEGQYNKTATSSHILPTNGRIYTTDGSRSSNSSLHGMGASKPYISVYFEWEVLWNSSNSENNRTYINTTLDLPKLYVVDLTQEQAISGTVSPEVGGENITITENLTNVGHDNSDPGYAQILSYVPNNTTDNNWREEGTEGYSWFIHWKHVKIYLNDTTQLENDTNGNCELQVKQTTESSEGLVNLTIYDLSSCSIKGAGTVGHILDEGQNVSIVYKAESNNDMRTGDEYQWYSIGTLNSTTDTQDSEYALTNQSISVAGKRMTGYKDLFVQDVTMPTMINATLYVTVEDTSDNGITGIKFVDYVPNGITNYKQYCNNVTVFFSDSGAAEAAWTQGSADEYDITYNGTGKTPDGLSVMLFEFVNATGNSTWNLTDQDAIRVTYQLNFTSPGLYVLPVTIAAFDPDTGLDLSTSFYGIIKVVLPQSSLALQIDETELVQSKTVLVGKPAMWNKEFNVYNPNPRTVNARFSTIIFKDASDGYVRYIDENGRMVEEHASFGMDPDGSKVMHWETTMKPLENRNYEVTILTPPVLEIDRDVEVLEQLPEKKVRLKMDVYLKSFAEEDYENVILNLPISYNKIEEVRDGFGNRIPFTGGKDSTTITVDRMVSGELKTITIIYTESYPTVIITPDRDRYNLNSPVSLEILVINGGEEIEYPFLEVEIYTPGMDVIFSDVAKLESLEPLEKTEMYQRFVVPSTAPAGNYIAQARFREDFAVLASATGNFYVLGIEGGIPGALEIVMILLVIAVLGYFSWRRLREVKGRQAFGRI